MFKLVVPGCCSLASMVARRHPSPCVWCWRSTRGNVGFHGSNYCLFDIFLCLPSFFCFFSFCCQVFVKILCRAYSVGVMACPLPQPHIQGHGTCHAQTWRDLYQFSTRYIYNIYRTTWYKSNIACVTRFNCGEGNCPSSVV